MSRIIFFPEPFPDEDFRSIVYRYHIRSINTDIVHTQFELFGVRSQNLTIFPRGLQLMLDNLPLGHEYRAEDFLYKHTWYGLYKSFLTDERVSKMLHNFKLYGSNVRGAEGQPRITGLQSVLSAEVKYCPVCVLYDLQTFGEAYVHRQHQVTFLDICPTHSVRLYTECPNCMKKYGNAKVGVLLSGVQCKCGCYLPVEYIEMNSMHQIQLKLLNDLVYSRDNYYKLNINSIIIKFMEQLFTKGFISPKGMISKREMLAYFISEYSQTGILKFVEENMEASYFRNVLFHRDYMIRHIPFYLLLAQLLCKSFRILTETHIQYALEIPFGNGPWACKNNKCPLYDVPIINRCLRNVNDESGVYSIKYDCDRCNYTSLICEERITYYKQKNSKYVKFDALNKIHTAHLEIAVASGMSFERRRQIYRVKMDELINEHSFETRSEVRKQAKFLYNWLMLYDKEWLELRIPKKKRTGTKKTNNFKAMDQDLQQKIRIAAESIPSDYHLLIRRETILRKLSPKDRNRFMYYYRELPLTTDEIDKFVETKKQFLIRSIPRHYSKIQVSNIKGITLSEFKEKASSSYYRNGDKEVDEHIRNFLSEKGMLI